MSLVMWETYRQCLVRIERCAHDFELQWFSMNERWPGWQDRSGFSREPRTNVSTTMEKLRWAVRILTGLRSVHDTEEDMNTPAQGFSLSNPYWFNMDAIVTEEVSDMVIKTITYANDTTEALRRLSEIWTIMLES